MTWSSEGEALAQCGLDIAPQGHTIVIVRGAIRGVRDADGRCLCAPARPRDSSHEPQQEVEELSAR